MFVQKPNALYKAPVWTAKASLAQKDWYIDPLHGDDAFSGTQASPVPEKFLGPIKTWKEYIARCGEYRKVEFALTFHLMGSVPDEDPIYANFTVVQLGSARFLAENSAPPLLSGNLSSFRTANLAAGIPWGLTVGGVTDWTPYIGKLLLFPLGPRGSSVRIIADEGGGVATVSAPSSYADDGNIALFAPSSTERFSIPTETSVVDWHVSASSGAGEPPLNHAPVFVDGLYFTTDIEWHGGNPGNAFQRCRFSSMFVYGSAIASACYFEGLFAIQAGGLLISYGSVFRYSVFYAQGSLALGWGSIFYGVASGPNPGDNGAQTILVHSNSLPGIAFLNCVGVPLTIYGGMYLRLRGTIWGNVAGPLINIMPGSRSTYSPSTTFLTGTGIRLNGKDSVRAFDDSSGTFTAPRVLTWASLALSVAAGGHGEHAYDPETLASFTRTTVD